MLKGKTQSEETKQSSEPDSVMMEMLELSDREFKIVVINMLRTLVGRQHEGICE